MIALPDIQNMTESPYIYMMDAIVDWIETNAVGWKVSAVIGLGDHTNRGENADWELLKLMWDDIRDSVVAEMPIMPIMGNHDYDDGQYGPIGDARDATAFLGAFGPGYYALDPYYGGCYNGTTENLYVIAGDFLIIGLELYPRDAVLTWAQGIIDDNPTKKVIIATHAYMLTGGALMYVLDNGITAGNPGTTLWSDFVSLNDDRIILVICGHLYGFTARSDLGDNRIRVPQLMANRQNINRGDGALTVLIFRDNGWLETISFSTLTDPITYIENSGYILGRWK